MSTASASSVRRSKPGLSSSRIACSRSLSAFFVEVDRGVDRIAARVAVKMFGRVVRSLGHFNSRSRSLHVCLTSSFKPISYLSQ
jgi:hypothetical protein